MVQLSYSIYPNVIPVSKDNEYIRTIFSIVFRLGRTYLIVDVAKKFTYCVSFIRQKYDTFLHLRWLKSTIIIELSKWSDRINALILISPYCFPSILSLININWSLTSFKHFNWQNARDYVFILGPSQVFWTYTPCLFLCYAYNIWSSIENYVEYAEIQNICMITLT